MNDSELDGWIKRLVNEEQYRQLSSAVLTLAKTDAINIIAQALVSAAPEYFEKKISIDNGGSNLFAFPSDCLMVKRIWDYGGNVGTVLGAADNGSGLIRITHNIVIPDDPSTMVFPFVFPFAFVDDVDETVVTLHSVGGCTEANGTFRAVYVDSTHIDLYGSTFTNAYTSGGRIYIEEPKVYANPIERKPSNFENAIEEINYFYREDNIVVDSPEFQNDIIMLYRYLPTTLAEIPSRYHYGIYAYAVMILSRIPAKSIKQGDTYIQNTSYESIKKNVDMCSNLWNMCLEQCKAFSPVKPTNNISNRSSIKKWL